MPNIALAREEIKTAAGLLVNRFGHESDVFAHLNTALAALKGKEVEIETETETVSTDASLVVVSPVELSIPPETPAKPPIEKRGNTR